MENQPTGGWRAFLRLIAGTKPPKWTMALALFLSVATTLAGLTIPLFTKQLVNHFSLSDMSGGRIAAMAAAFLVQMLAGGVSIYLLNRAGQSIVANLRDRLWRKLLILPLAYFDRHETGETISRMTNDTGVLKGLITEHLSGFFTGIISVIGAIAILLVMDWKMTALLLVAVPLTMLVLMPLGRQMYKISRGLQDETAGFTAVMAKVLSEARLVKASNAEPLEYDAGKRGIDRLFRFGLREGKVQALIGPLMMLVVMALMVTVVGYGGMRVASGDLTSGDLVAFILYLIQIVMPLGQITQFFTQLQKAKGATERIISTLSHEEENLADGKTVANMDQPLVVEEVSFAYAPEEPVLKKVAFTIEPGKTTALVGPSGSGKTTLFSLLERFYAPQEGTIRLGQRPIGDFSLRTWRSRIGYVSQESPLISGTIRENICYGLDRDVSEDELRQAAKMAYADEFIGELADGYDTQVGERGLKLSGGQRQRIAIARALLRDPDILMLDEATSNLDGKSEKVVQKALGNLMKGRTVVVIAHRLSTVIDADKIVFLDKGAVTGIGTHDELMHSHGMYKEFAEHQLRGLDGGPESAPPARANGRNGVSLWQESPDLIRMET